ncbi:MAG: hypothetical protein AAFY76_19505, partial [Cyanobacteria bacterium J06649_11]
MIIGNWELGIDNWELRIGNYGSTSTCCSILPITYSSFRLSAIHSKPHPVLQTPLSLLRRG